MESTAQTHTSPDGIESLNVHGLDIEGIVEEGREFQAMIDDLTEKIYGFRCEWVCYGYDGKTCGSFCRGFTS